MVNYADLWLIHLHVASLLDSARFELRELKSRSTLLGACTNCSVLRSNLEAAVIKIKDLKHKLDHSSRYTVLSTPCEACVSLKGKLLHATKENTDLQQEVVYLTARLEKTARLRRVQPSPHIDWVLGLRDVRKKVRRVLICLFLAPATIKKRKHSNQPKLTTHPTQSHPLTQREKQEKKPLSRERKLLFACFMAVLITWISFASCGRELRRGVLSMLETHIVMSLLIFHLILILMFRLAFTLMLQLALSHMLCLALLLVLFLSSLINPTIAHMVLVHERTALSLDALITAHVLIVVTVSRVGLVFPLEGPSPTLSRDTWTVHAFPIMVHIPLGQVVRCKGL
jgi:hypothetical protein